MSTPRTRAMRQAATSRTHDAATRVAGAIRELSKRDSEVSFASVAAAANVSRQFLYTQPELRSQIEQLRDKQRGELAHPATRERASDASIRTRLRAALDDNQRLREENTRLRDELALAHGSVRELQLERKTARSLQ